jgi:hypothetical protein
VSAALVLLTLIGSFSVTAVTPSVAAPLQTSSANPQGHDLAPFLRALSAAGSVSRMTSTATGVVSWQNITGSVGVAPSPRVGAATTYDAADGYVLLFGGENGAGNHLYSDTWKFQGGSWTNITATAGTPPSPRVSAGMAYDPVDSYVVLFGGLSVTPGDYVLDQSDTWTFHGGTWANISATAGSAPKGRFSPGMAFDWSTHEVVLFGGENANDQLLTAGINMDSDTWSFVHGGWTQITGSVGTPPSARAGVNMVYDPVDGYLLLYGGVWNTLSGTTITGYVTADTWRFTGTWTNLTSTVSGAPGNRALAGIAFDANAGEVVMVGGCTAYVNQACPLTNSTWAYRSDQWTDLSPTMSVAPSPRGTVAVTNDSADGYLLFFGGSCGTGCAQGDTWRDPAAPAVLSSVVLSAAPATCGPITIDGLSEASGSTLALPKGIDPLSVGACSDLAFLGWNSTGGTRVSSPSSPSTTLQVTGAGSVTASFSSPLGVGATANSTVVGLGGSVQLTAAAWGGAPPYSYRWAENGSNLSGSVGSSNPTTISFTHATTYSFVAWASDSTGRVAQSAPPITVKVLGYSPPPLTVNLTLNSYFAPAGTTLRATATTGGGTITAYGWTLNGTDSLPCASTTCAFPLPHGGTYGIAVEVTDSLGRTNSSASRVTIWDDYSSAPPSALSISLTANLSALTLGASVRLNSTASGGIPPYRFVLNETVGTTSMNSTWIDGWNYVFVPTVVGTYTLRMWLIDSAGEYAVSASITLSVAAPACCGATGGGGGPSGLPLYLIAALVVAVVAAFAVVLVLRRRRSPPTEKGAPPNPPSNPSTVSRPLAPPRATGRAPPLQPYPDERAPDPMGGYPPR